MTGIGQDAALLYEAESEEVVVARDTFASLRQYLVTLQDEVLAPSPCLLVGTPIPGLQEHNSAFHRTGTPLEQREGRICCTALHGKVAAAQPQIELISDDCDTPQCLALRITAQQVLQLTRCGVQTLAVGASLGGGGPRARKLQRLKSSFRSSSNISRLSTVQLIQQIQVSCAKQPSSAVLSRTHMTVEGGIGFAMVHVCGGYHAQRPMHRGLAGRAGGCGLRKA